MLLHVRTNSTAAIDVGNLQRQGHIAVYRAVWWYKDRELLSGFNVGLWLLKHICELGIKLKEAERLVISRGMFTLRERCKAVWNYELLGCPDAWQLRMPVGCTPFTSSGLQPSSIHALAILIGLVLSMSISELGMLRYLYLPTRWPKTLD